MATNSHIPTESKDRPTASLVVKSDSQRNEANLYAFLLIFLGLLAIGACYVLQFGYDLSRLKTQMAVTELDREQVFNEDNLRKAFPELAINLRTNVADFVAGNHYETIRNCITICIFMAAGNFVIGFIMLFRFRKTWLPDKSVPGNDQSP